MTSAAPTSFDLRRFRTSAEYYVRGRLSYPERLIAQVVALTKLNRKHAVLDLGCGPGFLAVAFAPYAGRVDGIDPEPAMIEVAEAYAREKDAEITFQLGSSYGLNPFLGPFHLVTMGRAFHWMERAETLKLLDPMVGQGALAFFSDTHPKIPENAWHDRYRAVLDPLARKDPGYAKTGGRDTSWLSDEYFLRRSPFSRLQRVSVVQRIETPVERLIDRALSMSSTSPEKLGREVDSVVRKLRETLSADAVDGVITEIVESEALVAFREEP